MASYPHGLWAFLPSGSLSSLHRPFPARCEEFHSGAALLWACFASQSLLGFSSAAVVQMDHPTHQSSVTARDATLPRLWRPTMHLPGTSKRLGRLSKMPLLKSITTLNKARLAKPSRNNFKLKPGTKASKRDETAFPRNLAYYQAVPLDCASALFFW